MCEGLREEVIANVQDRNPSLSGLSRAVLKSFMARLKPCPFKAKVAVLEIDRTGTGVVTTVPFSPMGRLRYAQGADIAPIGRSHPIRKV
jgi:hypothetical protein